MASALGGVLEVARYEKERVVELGALSVGKSGTADLNGMLDCLFYVERGFLALVGENERHAVLPAVGVGIADEALAYEFLHGAAYRSLVHVAQLA